MPKTEFHIDDETLEQYALAKLPDAELCLLEEHLLICHRCQDSLVAADQFIAGVREAGPKLRASSGRPRPAAAWAAAALVLLIAAGWWAARQPTSSDPPVAVLLIASRGEPAPAVAPARRRIALSAEAPSPGPLGFVVVDSGGRTRAEAPASRQGDRALAVIDGLGEGLYFVRLHNQGGVIEREFRMEVR